jgi:uncharacterized protein YjbI with pentapeptide repeats
MSANESREGVRLMATDDKSSQSADLKKLEHPQKHWLGVRGYDKITEEYDHDGNLSKVTREHQRGKTAWDWLQLLIIPFVLGAGAIWFNFQQNTTSSQASQVQHAIDQKIAQDNRQNDLKIVDDQQQEATLKAYLDDMTTLLLDDKLGSQAVADKALSAEAAIVARAKTLTALSRLTDPQRKARVVQFLYEAHLIGYYDSTHSSLHNPIIDLSDADLSRANLGEVILSGNVLSIANLSGANLSNANLSGADLSSAELSLANLSGADLRDADLLDTILQGIHLDGAFLKGAYLSSSDLSSSDFNAVVNGAFLSGANLYPNGLVGADLFTANLNGATLRGAHLSEADLSGARLNGADLSGVDLSGADLSGAHLSDASVTPEQLAKAKSLKGATMPDGSIHP